MPRNDSEVRITPSILDRLIDYEPELSRDPSSSRHTSLRFVKQTVRRDLEWLLNTRQDVDGIPADLEELTQSLGAYGLPDFTAVSLKNPAEQDRIRRALQSVLDKFEPRLKDVTVALDFTNNNERALRFRINANLQVEPAPEPVTFDATLHPQSGQYKVQEEQ
jgi:type VI secretion system protein ImpF